MLLSPMTARVPATFSATVVSPLALTVTVELFTVIVPSQRSLNHV